MEENLPNSWCSIFVEEGLLPYENGKRIRQGWSPQCERFPAKTNNDWGVLKTSAIQDGFFVDVENKHLPEKLEPKEHLEVLKGDILITCAGPRARCGVACLVRATRPKLIISGKMYQLRCDADLLLREFLEAFLREPSTQKAIDKMKTGINDSGLNLTRERFSQLQVPLPPLNEQKRIVAKIEELFSELDAGEASLRQARAQLGVYRQALLKKAFSGELTAKWRADNPDQIEPAEKLLERIRSEREARYIQQLTDWKTAVQEWEAQGKKGKKPTKPKKFKELGFVEDYELANLPEIPNGWGWLYFGAFFDGSPQNGAYKPASQYGSGTQIVRIDDFYDGALIRNEGFKRLILSPDEVRLYGLSLGDILVNRVNSMEYLGKCCEITKLNEDLVFESNIMRIKTVDTCVYGQYLIRYLASYEGRNHMCANAKQAVNQASINQTDVSLAQVPFCSLPEQKEIVRILEAQFEAIEQNEREIDAALERSAALRQSILKRAFSGKLVEQDPNDEPATVLLERIRQEREAAVVTKTAAKKATKKRARKKTGGAS